MLHGAVGIKGGGAVLEVIAGQVGLPVSESFFDAGAVKVLSAFADEATGSSLGQQEIRLPGGDEVKVERAGVLPPDQAGTGELVGYDRAGRIDTVDDAVEVVVCRARAEEGAYPRVVQLSEDLFGGLRHEEDVKNTDTGGGKGKAVGRSGGEVEDGVAIVAPQVAAVGKNGFDISRRVAAFADAHRRFDPQAVGHLDPVGEVAVEKNVAAEGLGAGVVVHDLNRVP